MKDEFEDEVYDTGRAPKRKMVITARSAVIFIVSAIFFAVGVFSVVSGFKSSASTLEKQGVYTFTATRADYELINESKSKKDSDNYNYYIYYTSDETGIEYKELVDKETYDDFKAGTYTDTVVKSYWKSPDGYVTKLADEDATEEDVLEDVESDSSYSKEVGCVFIFIAVVNTLRTLKRCRR